MPARTTLLIIFLTLFTTGLVAYSLVLDAQKKVEPVAVNLNPTPQTSSQVEKSAVLAFTPSVITYNALTSTVSAEIYVDPQDIPITGVQVELAYDPAVITQIRLATPSSSVTNHNNSMVEIYQNVNQESGRISYLMGINPTSGTPQSGRQTVLNLIMRVNPQTLGTGTEITFLDRSLVTSDSTPESILGNRVNLQILPVVFPTIPLSTPSASIQEINPLPTQ